MGARHSRGAHFMTMSATGVARSRPRGRPASMRDSCSTSAAHRAPQLSPGGGGGAGSVAGKGFDADAIGIEALPRALAGMSVFSIVRVLPDLLGRQRHV